MVYRRPKALDEGEDGSHITHVPRRLLESWDGAREDLDNPNPRNVMLRSETGRAMIAAKHKLGDEIVKMNSDIEMMTLSFKFERLDVTIKPIKPIGVDDEDSDESDHGPSSEPTDVASPRSASSSAAPTEASTSRLNETSSDVAADEEDSPEQSDESPDSPIATGQLFTTPLNLPLAGSEQSHHEEITPDGQISTGRLFDTPSLSEDEEESSGDDQENVPPTPPRDEHVPAEAHEEANAMDAITHAREVARLTYAGQTAEAASMVATRLRQNRYVDEDAIYDEMLRLMREKVAAERRVSATRDSFVSVYTNETDRLRSADRNEEADRIEVCFKHLQFMEPEDVGEARYLAAAERLRELERLDGAGASTSFEKYQGEDENETKETQRPKIGTGGEHPENLFFAAAIRRVLPDWVNENPSVAESLPSEMNGPGDFGNEE